MKRWSIKLALCLLVGAVITWAVAWGCALWGEMIFSVQDTWEEWPSGVPTNWPPPHRTVIGSNMWQTDRFWSEDDDETHRIAYCTEAGLPLRAMRTMIIYDHRQPVLVSQLKPPSWMRPRYSHQQLPTQVLPLGFALNTMLAASIILGLSEGAGAWRRRARRRKGRCQSCGYDRAGIADGATVCPECGR